MICFTKEVAERVSVDSRQIVTFETGFIGLPQLRVFALIEDPETVPVRLLECISVPGVVFVVVNPFAIYPEYDIEISDEDGQELGITSVRDVLVLSIVTIPEDERFVTANLLSPLIINMRTKRGKQLLLSDTDYPINFRVLNQRAEGPSSNLAPVG